MTGRLLPLEDLEVEVGGRTTRFVELDDSPPHLLERIADEDPDDREYAVPVRWLATVPLDAVIFDSGLRAQQLPCRLMQQRTIDDVEAAFGLTTPTTAASAAQGCARATATTHPGSRPASAGCGVPRRPSP